MRVAGVPQRDGIDLVDVPRHERGKGFLGAAIRVFAQQSIVIQFLHLHLIAAKGENVTVLFSSTLATLRCGIIAKRRKAYEAAQTHTRERQVAGISDRAPRRLGQDLRDPLCRQSASIAFAGQWLREKLERHKLP
jgi:hypothetical protein